MEEERYLYGAAVQGIQGFIFSTNELKDIVGASELVEEICTEAFKEFAGGEFADRDKPNVLGAAGNIKHIFDSREKCEKAVLNFPKKVVEMAPGITVSQAVVKLDKLSNFNEAVDKLEERLRAQRNKPMRSTTLGLMGVLRSRKTGLPATEEKEGEFLDRATVAKRNNLKKGEGNSTIKLCRKSFGIEDLTHGSVAYNIEDITRDNDWIAIIHADGNGLGQVVQKVGNNKDEFKEFSQNLDNATIKAAQEAFNTVWKFKEGEKIPFRPVVLGGDDLTMICRGDQALPYAEAFIKQFEKNTEELLGTTLTKHKVFADGTNHLTACAGIAFVKSSWPFYYGYHLAEALCDAAKKDAKANLNPGEIAQSCLLFHKVQDSFAETYDDIVKRELLPNKNVSFAFGPYYINQKANRWTVERLIEETNKLADNNDKAANAVKSHLRQWMSLLHTDKAKADQKIKRVLALLDNKNLAELVKTVTMGESHGEKQCYPVYDMLALNTINHQVTK